MPKEKPQQLASADPAGDQQNRTDAAADQAAGTEARAMGSAEQADRIAALEQQLGEATGAPATTQREAAGLTEEVEGLKIQLAKSVEETADEHAKGADVHSSLLQAQEAVTHAQERAATAENRVTELEADLTAARAEFATAAYPKHDEDTLHNLWCAAGGKLGDFEAVKRFYASL